MAKITRFFMLVVIAVIVFFYWRDQSRRYHYVYQSEPSYDFVDVKEVGIGTYNIKSLNGGQSLDDLVSELKDVNLDIICFEEVDQKSWRVKGLETMAEVAKASGYGYYYFYETMFLGIGYYGLGIISRYPIMEVQSEPLNVSFLKESRILAYAKIDVGAKPLDVYWTHLSFRPFEDKYQQMDILQERFSNSERTILIGDFNIFRDEDFFEIEGMLSCNKADDKYLTFRDFGFPDNIFYSDDLKMRDIAVYRSSFSDHNLFYGYLKIQ